MRKIRFYLALWVAKAAQTAMKLLGRNASYLPGMLAVKLCPDFMGHLRLPKTVIAVTGTNGKTTVSNMLTSVLTANGYSVTNNSFGSNVQAGVASALLQDSNLLGQAKKDIAVLEVDERSSLLVYPYVKPDYLICNNIMRDSNKRNAHTDFIRYIINRALPASTKVILNADDMNCSRLGLGNEDRTYFGICAERPEISVQPYISDVVYCPKCGQRLESEYLRYNHIGRMYCPSCDLKSPDPHFLVTDIDRKNSTFTVSHSGKEETYPLVNDNIVNVYNLCGVVALLTRLGLSYEQICTGLSASKIVKSRYDQLTSGELTITMQLAKGQNPIACARCFHYVAQCPGENKTVIVLVDDKGDNTNNSENICWLYDCDYSYLADPSIRRIIFSGPRCKDHYLRALLSGVPAEKILQTPEFTGGAELADPSISKDFYVLYDPYSLEEAAHIKNKLIQLGKEA